MKTTAVMTIILLFVSGMLLCPPSLVLVPDYCTTIIRLTRHQTIDIYE